MVSFVAWVHVKNKFFSFLLFLYYKINFIENEIKYLK